MEKAGDHLIERQCSIENELKTKVNLLTFKDSNDIQKHLIDKETNLLELARLGNLMTDRERTATLLRTLPNSLVAITLLVDLNNMDYDQVVSLICSEMDRGKHRVSATTLPVAANNGQKDSPNP